MFSTYITPTLSAKKLTEDADSLIWTSKRAGAIVGSHISKLQHDLSRIDQDEPEARYKKGALSILSRSKAQLIQARGTVETRLDELQAIQEAAPIYVRFGSALINFSHGIIQPAEETALNKLQHAIKQFANCHDQIHQLSSYAMTGFKIPEEIGYRAML